MANTKENIVTVEETVENEPVMTDAERKAKLDEIRRNTRITIMLPYVTNSDKPELDNSEEVQVNGHAVQIKRGEPVAVDWITFEALINSGRYDAKQICV